MMHGLKIAVLLILVKNSIKFYKNVPERVQQLIKGLEGEFQRMREELEYYETDYRTKMIQSK